jgi:hypothetical protein
VIRGPGDHVTLQGEAAGDGEAVAQATVGLERAVGEVAVETGGNPEGGYQVKPGGEPDVEPGQAPPPRERHGGDQGEHREEGEHPDQQLFVARLGRVENRFGSARSGRCRARPSLARSRRSRGGCSGGHDVWVLL